MSLFDKLLRLFGSSEQRLRWRLHQWRVSRDAGQQRRKNLHQQLRYRHKLCDHCGGIVDRQTRICPYCQKQVSSWWSQLVAKVVRRLFPYSGSMTTVLLLANGAVFLYITMVTGDLMGLSGYTAVHFGANYGPYMSAGGEWWRLVTYNFIHPGGLMHVGFNLIALTIIGPVVEQYYGSSRATVLYVSTGVAAGIVSHLFDPLAVSGGASGAVMGLIGAGVAAGHLEGTQAGKAMRNSLVRWVLLVALFGIVVPGIDNWAHFGGFFAGLLAGLGLAVKTRLNPSEQRVFRMMAAALVAGCLVSLSLAYGAGGDRPNDLEEQEVLQLWTRCRSDIDALRTRQSPLSCETFARARLLQEPLSTLLAAQLHADNGYGEVARRLLAILANGLGLDETPPLPGPELVIPLRNTIEYWFTSGS